MRLARSASQAAPAAPPEFSPHGVSRGTRLAAAKALRAKVERRQLGVWNAARHRRGPIDVLRASDADRVPDLIPIRYGRMVASPFAFYRGSADVMAADLARMATTDLHVQACGDCHLANFGGFATPERNIIFDINDFDETLPASWDWDVRRLVASIVLAGRLIGVSDKRARGSAIGCARSYRKHLRTYAEMDPLRLWYTHVLAEDVVADLPRRVQKRVERRIEKARTASGSDLTFPKVADVVGGRVRIADQPPLIFHREMSKAARFDKERGDLLRAFRETLSDDRRLLLDRYTVVDAAMKVVGIGSVGRRCWIALLMSDGNNPLFLQFKEATSSVLERCAGASAYRHHGQRVVMGQRLMQPASDIFLGWLTGPEGRHFYARQLSDGKIKPVMESFDAELLDVYSVACGHVLARAHARSAHCVATISGYLGASSDEFDDAMGDFAVAYADQAERDHAALKAAVRSGRVNVIT